MLHRRKLKVDPVAVAQEHPLGCGVACVAFRCGITYLEALSLFVHAEHAWTRGFYCSEIVAALAKVGLDYSFAKVNFSNGKGKLIKNGTIIFIGQCEKYPAGHFLIRSKFGWMNPWANFPLIKDVYAEIQTELPAKIEYVIFENGKSATVQCQFSSRPKLSKRS